MKLPSISSYYDYSSKNYGVNSLMVEFESLKLYYSYDTIVAFWTPETGLKCVKNYWSTTTGKHLNAIEPDKSRRLTQDEIQSQLALVLSLKGLIK